MPIIRNYPLLFIEVERPLILCQERLCSEPWRNLALGNELFNMCKPCTRTKLPENQQYLHWWIGGYLGGVPQSSIFSLCFSPNLRVFLGTLFSIFPFTNYVAHYPFSLQILLCTFASTCSSLLQAASFKTTATFCHNLQSKFLNFFNNIQILWKTFELFV